MVFRKALAAAAAIGLVLSGYLFAPAPPAHAATCTPTYTADGRPTINPTGAGPGTGLRIGFDATHGETAGQADWVIDGGFSSMACDLAALGYTVEEIRSYPLTQTALAAFNAVVIPEPNIPFTTAEEQELQSYVAAGGGLLLVGDHYQADRNYNTWDPTEVFNGFRRGHYRETFTSPYYNYNGLQTSTTYTFNDGNDWLASAFGFRFRSNAMDLVSADVAFGPGDAADPDDPGILPPEQTYGLTAGVNRIATYAGSTLSIVDPTVAMGIIYPNQGTIKRWVNAQSNDPVALYTDNVGTPAGGAVTYGGRSEGAYVVVAKPGAGKVAAAGDSSLWEDKSPKYRKETDGTTKSTHDGWLDSDHDTLALNLVNWLATPDPTPGIDPALQQSVTPEPYNIFTLAEPLNEPWATGPSGYKWYDSTTFRAGAYGAPTGGGTPPPTGSELWQWESVSLNAYPNNNLALFLNVQGLTPGGTSTNQAYVYQSGGSPLIGKRYNRTTGTYAGGTDTTSNQQTVPVAADGTIKRWEFWQLTNATSARSIIGRIRVGSTNKATTPNINQKPTSGSYGFLKVENSLGYNDGLHAALFTTGSTLDTAVQILKTTDTTITLAPGTYSLEIRNDTDVKRTGVAVTITAGQTVSLAQLLEGGGGNPNAGFAFSSVPENSYPGNRLAIYLDGHALAAGAGYSTDAFLSAAASNQAISRRYDRASGTFTNSATQSVTADGAGEVHRWEFWDLDQVETPRSVNARVRLNGTETDSREVVQSAGGTYGYLTVEASLGYADGLHAALFKAGSTLDTAVWLSNSGDTTITLPPGTYTLEIRNDTAAERSGIPVAIAEGQTVSLNQLLNGGGGQPQPGWSLNSVPAHAYPGNRLAILLDGNGLPAGTTYSTKAYVYVTGPGTQISKRYNRSTGTFIDGLTAQNLTTDGLGQIHRWEFWELTSSADRGISARVTIDGARKDTENLQQVKTGAFGYLTIPASLGYSDGLHAALFTVDGALDTTAWIAKNADTTVTLPAGTYTVAIWNDAGAVVTDLSVQIIRDETVSLANAFDQTPPVITAERTPANEYGWNNDSVTVTFACDDAESGVASCSDAITLTDEGRGQHVTGTATDNAGHTTTLTVSQINIDLTAPETSASEPFSGNSGVTVTLTATDALSGVAATYYRVDNGDEQTGTRVTVSENGTHTVTYWSVDKAGNADAPGRLTVSIDRNPPEITAERTPANEYGWNNADVTVTFACDDAESGVASCSDAITLTGEGRGQSVTGTATDNAGNAATLTVSGINIDRTAPEVTVTGARTYSVDETVQIECAATDALAGLAEDPCAAPLAAGPAHTFGLGTHTLTVVAEDRAGNRTEVTVEFTVTVTYDSLANLTRAFATEKGLQNSLTAKLAAAEKAAAEGNTGARDGALGAYINEVQAQTGKKLPADKAALLEALATALMSAE